jgi:hypothetical protein
MTFALVSLVATLALILALNWGMFERVGWGRTLRMLLIWGVILAGGVLLLRLLGF